jgi:ubiquinone/menaquinone biosynthesis C-methylase UbiE
MTESSHEQAVNAYYDIHTRGFYLEKWHHGHIHFGIFDERKDAFYEEHPESPVEDRDIAINRMTSLIVDSANIQPGELVVDAGWGVGGTALHIAATLGNQVVGLNINEQQITIARERTDEAGLADKVRYEYADCSQLLPLDDASVDVIINIESACHYSNRARFIEECARVLKPSGRIAAQDWMATDTLTPDDQATYIKPLEAAWVMHDLDSLTSYRGLLETAGLRVSHSMPLTEGIRPNGYIMKMCYEVLSAKEALSPLGEYESGNRERFRTFADALLNGYLVVGHYVAIKMKS